MTVKAERQKIFDKVARHLLKQRKPSMVERRGVPMCAYRGRGGLKCAIGALMLDADYRKKYEGLGVSDLPPPVVDHIMPEDKRRLEFLSDLQTVHDYGEGLTGDVFVSFIKRRLSSLADDYRLSKKVLSK